MMQKAAKCGASTPHFTSGRSTAVESGGDARSSSPASSLEEASRRLATKLARAASARRDALERTRVKARAVSHRVSRAAARRRAKEHALAMRTHSRLQAAAVKRDELRARRVASAARRNQAAAANAAATAVAAAVVADTLEKAIAEAAQTFDDEYDQASHPGECEMAAAKRLQRAWRRFSSSSVTTAALASAFTSLNLSAASAAASDDFDAFAGRLQCREALQIAAAFLERVAHLVRNVAGNAEDVSSKALLRCLFPVKKPNLHEAPKAKENAYPTRVVLCAYMIAAHPEVVLGGVAARSVNENGQPGWQYHSFGPEADLQRSAGALVASIDNLVAAANNRGTKKSIAAAAFAAAWGPYLQDFVAWKTGDAALLERELIRIAVELEGSMLRKCGTDATAAILSPNLDQSSRAPASSPTELSDLAAMRAACAEDRKLLRSKVAILTGEGGCARFDAALADVFLTVEDEEEEAAAVEAEATAKVDPVHQFTGVAMSRRAEARAARRAEARAAMRTANARHRQRCDQAAAPAPAHNLRSAGEGKTNESLMHELLIDPNWRLTPTEVDASDDAANAAARAPSGNATPIHSMQDLETRLQAAMEETFWKQIAQSLASTMNSTTAAAPTDDRGLALIAELRAELEGLCPSSARDAHDCTTLDALSPSSILPLISAAATDPAATARRLGEVLAGATAMLLRLCDPSRRKIASVAATSLEDALASRAAAATDAADAGDNSAAATIMSDAVTQSLRFLFEELRRLQSDSANAALTSLAPLARGPAGAAWARERFAARHGLTVLASDSTGDVLDGFRVMDSLPRATAWLAAAMSRVHKLDAELPALVTAKRIASPSQGEAGFEHAHAPNKEGALKGGIRAENVPSMRTGYNVARSVSTDSRSTMGAIDNVHAAADWASVPVCTPEGMVRVAVASLIAESSPMSSDHLPETLEFDGERHMSLQNEFQRLRALAACLLLAQPSVTGGSDSGSPSDSSDGALSTEGFRHRVEALLSDPEIRIPDLALEVAMHVQALKGQSSNNVRANLTIIEPTLRKLISNEDPMGRALCEALLGALCARLLVGENFVSGDAEMAAAAASAVSRDIAKMGFSGSVGVGLVKDVSRLARQAMKLLIRVTWKVHAPMYVSICRQLLAEEDEL